MTTRRCRRTGGHRYRMPPYRGEAVQAARSCAARPGEVAARRKAVHPSPAYGEAGAALGSRQSRSTARLLALPSRLLLRLQLLQILLQAIEARLPEPAIMREPIGGVAHWRGVEPARPPLRLAPPRDQAGAFEHLEVLGDAGKTHVERLGELGHRGLAKRKPRQDGAPGRIGERRERARKAIRRHGIEPIS